MSSVQQRRLSWVVLLAFLGWLSWTMVTAEVVAPEDAPSAATETPVDAEDTPVLIEPLEAPNLTGQDRPWRAPNYKDQNQALGYTEDAFAVPVGLAERVQFWEDIYTKYTTDQGVLHDSRYVNLIYEVVDFSDISAKTDLTLGQRERERKQRVKLAKRGIEERLRRLQKLKSGEGLEGDDLRYWNLFQSIDESNKFVAASQRGRLRFQLGQRDRFIEGIYQSGRYLEEMEEIFRREGLPLELTRLPFVESSFNLRARSKVGASGIWQFMRSTARLYMRMDSATDERNDPLTATVAAARKLRSNYAMLGNWPLAVTAYNHGPSGMQRLVRKYKTTDISEITDVRRGRFGFASANFFASFLAAVRVERDGLKHFGPLKWMPALRGEVIRLEKPLSIAQLLSFYSGNQLLAEDLNPHVRPHVWRQKSRLLPKSFIRVPVGQADSVRAALQNLKVETVAAVAGDGESYVVQPGETLSEIADRQGVRLRALMELNEIGDPRELRAGQKILLPETKRSN